MELLVIMNYIKRKKLDIEIDKFIKNGKPVLGICFGFSNFNEIKQRIFFK